MLCRYSPRPLAMLKGRFIERVIRPRGVVARIAREKVGGLQRDRHHLDGHHWEIYIYVSAAQSDEQIPQRTFQPRDMREANEFQRTKPSFSTLSFRIAQTPSPVSFRLWLVNSPAAQSSSSPYFVTHIGLEANIPRL
jgi:hypothetical protein